MMTPHSTLPAYAELQVTTNYTFLTGGSHPDELVAQAKALGLAALAVTDRNTLAGVVRAHVAAKQVGLRLIIGSRLDLAEGMSLICLPTDRAAYGRLCRLLSLGQRRAGKGQCILHLDDVAAHAEGQILIALPPDDWDWRETVSDILSDTAGTPSHVGWVTRAATDVAPGHGRGRARNPAYDYDGTTSAKVSDILSDTFGTAVATVSDQRSDTSTTARIIPFPGRPAGQSPAATPDAPAAVSPWHGTLQAWLRLLRTTLPAPLHLAAAHRYRGEDRARIAALAALAQRLGLRLVATGDVLYHAPQRRELQDVLTCIRLGLRIDAAGHMLQASAERHLKGPAAMARLFRGFEDALAATLEIAEACRFSLDELVYEYPDEPIPPGRTPQTHLEDLVHEGARWRFPDGITPKVGDALARELALIAQLNYAPYFLTVHDIVGFARARGILCQGRGSAANSAVCYCLGITAVDPTEVDLLFERFISPERKEPPDIDVDFEHERREEVIQYIYARYGRHRAGLAATVISYRARSAVREVGKAMGLSPDTVAALAGMVWGTRSGDALPEKHVREAGLDPTEPLLARVLELSAELTGFPRHLSQHVGGFVLTRGPLDEVVPIGNAAMADRTVIEWDKDDIAALGLLKVDVLALGMLSCIRRAFALLEAHHARPMTLASVPRQDKATFDMLCRADSIGVFQVESRAQMNMLPRLRPRTFYDLVIEVAIVRPGPIQGDMVHPYLRRRSGLEPEAYPSPAPEHGPADELRQILAKTKGVPLFQEQAMRIAMVAARFSDAEVNDLRRAMATFRRVGTIGQLEDKMVSAMVRRGYTRDFAERCFNQIKGFGDYGFPESHAASFAHLVYVSAWLKCHYPAAFACALLNAQPMGFYAPAQIVRDAKEHGVEVLPVDVNHSDWDCTLEDGGRLGYARQWSQPRNDAGAPRVTQPTPSPVLRLGLRQIDGLNAAEASKLVAARAHPLSPSLFSDGERGGERGKVFTSVHDLWLRAGLSHATLEKLAAADAFGSVQAELGFAKTGLDRRQALWEVKALAHAPPLPLFQWRGSEEGGTEPEVVLPVMPLSEHVVNDYQTLRLSLKAHPMSFLRERLRRRRVAACLELRNLKDGAAVSIAGVVLVRQRPGTAKGVVFMTLEDETGVANAVVWPKTLERFRRVVMGARLMVITGRIQRHEDIIHVVCGRLEDRSDWLRELADADRTPTPPSVRQPSDNAVPASEPGCTHTASDARGAGHPRAARIIPKSRDFH